MNSSVFANISPCRHQYLPTLVFANVTPKSRRKLTRLHVWARSNGEAINEPSTPPFEAFGRTFAELSNQVALSLRNSKDAHSVLAASLLAENVRLGALLGKGSRASVYEAHFAGKRFAVKALLRPTPATLAELKQEAEVLQCVRSSCVVALNVNIFDPRTSSQLSPVPFLCTELLDGGTLYAALKARTLVDVRTVAVDVARGLEAIHASGHAHRDVKAANVMLTASTSGTMRAKLIDLGSASRLPALPSRPRRHLFVGEGSFTTIGTLLWMAPELIEPHIDGESPPPGATGATADIHSFGVLLWELLERKLPWTVDLPVSKDNVRRVVVKERRRLPIPPFASPALAKLMTECWAHDPRERPSAAALVERLSALRSWDTDGRLARRAAGDESDDGAC